MRVRDCASQLRIVYVRRQAFALDDLRDLLVGEPTLHRFAAFVKGARDAWSADLVGGARATGAEGGRSLVVTYGKLGRDALAAQPLVEAWLAEHWGPVLVVDSLPDADRWFDTH